MTATVLFDYPLSSASYRVRIALNLAGIEFQSVPVDLLAGEQRGPDHLARHPRGFVPVLDIDGQRFTQSLAILEYLDATRDLGLVPQDPVEAAKVRALAQTIAVDIHPVCNTSVVAAVMQMSDDPDAARLDWMGRFIGPGLNAFAQLMEGFAPGPYACGDSVTQADLCLVPQLFNARRWQVDYAHLPRLNAVDEALGELPAFRAAHPEAMLNRG